MPDAFPSIEVRACSESPRVRMAKPDFSPDEAKIAGNTLCINENFGKIWRERCKPDVRGEILNRLLEARRAIGLERYSLSAFLDFRFDFFH